MGMFNFFQGFSLKGIIHSIIWIVVFIIFTAIAGFLVYLMIKLKDSIEVWELNEKSKKVRRYLAFKKKKAGTEVYYSKKLGKIPKVQQEFCWTRGKRDVLLIVRDNNGMIHLPKLACGNPSYELQKNPHEDLNWLAYQVADAGDKFKFTHWWQSPTIMFIGTAFICMITFIATIILAKKL